MYRRGNYASAMPLLEDRPKTPDSADFHYHLGMALLERVITKGKNEPGGCIADET